jgi:integrase
MRSDISGKKLSLQQQQQKANTVTAASAVVSYKSKYSPYQKFLNSINTPETKKTYVFHLTRFLDFSEFNDYSQLLEIPDEQKTDLIQEFIQSYKKKGLSYQTINTAFASVKLFYEENGIERLPWKRLSRQKGKRKRVVDDRLYEPEELKHLIEHANLREKVAILTLLTTGMRIGALAGLKWEDVKEIPEHGIYRFRPYSDDMEERYYTFCTPECAKYIKLYRQDREVKQGEKITDSSPFIIHKNMSPKSIKNKGFYDPKALSQVLERQRYRANIMSPEKIPVSKKGNKKGVVATGFGKIRKEVPRTHVFRKIFATTCNKLGMNTTIKEKLMGHKTGQGLDIHYDRTTEETFIQEYMKVVDALTVNEENRLKHEVVELRKENEEIKLLKLKEKERDEELDNVWDTLIHENFEREFLLSKIKRLERQLAGKPLIEEDELHTTITPKNRKLTTKEKNLIRTRLKFMSTKENIFKKNKKY